MHKKHPEKHLQTQCSEFLSQTKIIAEIIGKYLVAEEIMSEIGSEVWWQRGQIGVLGETRLYKY